MLGVGVGCSPVFQLPVAAGGSSGFSAPVLSFAADHVAGTNPLEWDSDFTAYLVWDGVNTGDKHLMRWRRVPAGAWTTEVEQGLDTELLSGGFTWPLWEAAKPLAAGYVEVQEQRARYIAGVETLRSDWSNALTDTLAGVPFVPSSVTGIKDYYEVKASKLFKDTAGTTPVTADGDLVARWNSELGTMSQFVQATSGSRPIYRVSGAVEWLDFDGVDDNMACGTTGIGTMFQPIYAMVACKLTALVGSQGVFDGTTVGNRMNLFQNNIGSPNSQWEIGAGTFVGTQGMVPTTNDSVVGGLFSGAASKGRLDQTDGSVISIGTASPIDGIKIGSKYDGTTCFAGRLYGLVIVAASPSAGDKTNISTWLGALQGRTI